VTATVWKPYQQLRLAQEEAALRSFMPGFQFYNRFTGTYVGGDWMSNTNRQYQIRIYVPKAYPDDIPHTYVTSPSPLYGYGVGNRIEAYGDSHSMHTWKTDQPGWVKICIVRPEDWSAAYSLVKVLRKAMLWLTAYECHLDDGTPIANFLI
jgi:ubiquitin-protein ligase